MEGALNQTAGSRIVNLFKGVGSKNCLHINPLCDIIHITM